MVKIVELKGSSVPDGFFANDGSYKRCAGRHIAERITNNWLPCFNVTFIVQRVLGTVCADNIDRAARKHDVTTMRESWFYQCLNEMISGLDHVIKQSKPTKSTWMYTKLE